MSNPYDRLLSEEEVREAEDLARTVVEAHAARDWPPADAAGMLLTFAHMVLGLCRHVEAQEEVGRVQAVERWK
jgi:hypothetical protein